MSIFGPEDRHEDGHAPPPGGVTLWASSPLPLAKPRARCTGRDRGNPVVIASSPTGPTPCPRVRAVAPPRTSWGTTSTPATRWGAVATPATAPTPPAHPGHRQHQLVRGDRAPITFDHPNAPAMRPGNLNHHHLSIHSSRLGCGSAAIGMVDWRRSDALSHDGLAWIGGDYLRVTPPGRARGCASSCVASVSVSHSTYFSSLQP